MTTERYLELDRDEETHLTASELAEGWHFCPEFDGLLTQGECKDEQGICICKFPQMTEAQWLLEFMRS